MPATLVTASASAARLAAARARVAGVAGADEVLIVGASRAAADELAAAVAIERGGLVGVRRMSLHELVTKLALPELARDGLSPASALAVEAVVTRATFDAREENALRYFAPVAGMPGFPRAAARTLSELQLGGVVSDALPEAGDAGRDLAVLMARVDDEARRAGAVTRAEVLEVAARILETTPTALGAGVLVLLDVPVTTAADERFVATLVLAARDVLATVPAGDAATVEALARCGVSVTSAATEARDVAGTPGEALGRLQQYLFSPDAPPEGTLGDSVEIFSAPGEGREAVEVARRIVEEAARGVPFDEMAVVLRAPHTYFGLIEHALSRAGIPAWFERGTRRPDPAGRAFLALLACADEDLSARRFAEYLSFGQVPLGPGEGDGGGQGVGAQDPKAESRKPKADSEVSPWSPPTDEASEAIVAEADRAEDPAPEDEAPAPGERDGDRIVGGTLVAPWRWEELLVEAYVIKGLDRWRSRLPGLDEEYVRRLRELADEDHDSPRIAAIERSRRQLAHLEGVALPIVETLDEWRDRQPWSVWLDRFHALLPRVLRKPARVQRVLTEMAPLGGVGPVTLREVREVLAPRLRTLTSEPSRRRHGRVFVGTPASTRGRSFRVVFVPGLAERVFPQRLREDALLVDRCRRQVDGRLATNETRADEERLQLHLAVGAARERVYLSYPRVELRESRPRVPSFYVLDVVRATTGAIPRYAELAEQASRAGGASLAWPAPRDPARAIDDFEHDLAVLLPLVTERDRKKVHGRARYLIDLNAALRRSVTERWARWQPRWSKADGLVTPSADALAVLASERLTARPYSLTGLQRYAACPYQFLLSAIYRLAPLEEPAPLQRLDPLTRGSLFHEIQATFLRQLHDERKLPVTAASLAAAKGKLEWVVGHVTKEAADKLAPAIERVWKDEVASLRRDLLLWLEKLAEDGREWTPEHFEFAFGLPPEPGRDPASTSEPAVVDGRFKLRGSVDLVERHQAQRALRVTDHKTGKNRTNLATIVDGGRVLQPVLYGLALEALTGDTVYEGRLSYCTTAGGFTEHHIPLVDVSRRRGLEVLEIIDRAIERGVLAARPQPHRDTCRYCDFQPVCGRDEERRTSRKPEAAVADLEALRRLG